MLERQVNAGRQKRRRYDETDDLCFEACIAEGVEMQQDSADVANSLSEAAQYQGGHEGPCSMAPAEVDVDDTEACEVGQEEGVSGQ